MCEMVWKTELSRSGMPCLWEKGGGATNTGNSQIIAMPDGSKPRALYIKGRGHLSGGEHALVHIVPGMYVIRADHHRLDFVIEIYQITSVDIEEIRGTLVNDLKEDWWNPPLDEKFEEAVRAAKDKANHYHCREPHFVERG